MLSYFRPNARAPPADLLRCPEARRAMRVRIEKRPIRRSPLALPRASIQGVVRQCEPDSSEYQEARATYLAKLPDAEELFTFSDFSLFIVEPIALRYVAGFGRAMSL